jgi:probable rRNA maturation factor
MFEYNLASNSEVKLNTDIIDKLFKKISDIVSKEQKWALNIVFVDTESIKNLNNKYRKINKATDVLSFHYFSDFSSLKSNEIAWEIVMCSEKIKLQGIEYGLWEDKEFYKLLIHSVLHILWYDHEDDYDYKTMSEFEKTIWEEVFEK